MARFKAYVQTSKIGSRCEDTFEIDDEDFEGMDEGQREQLISDCAHELLLNSYDWGWDEIEG